MRSVFTLAVAMSVAGCCCPGAEFTDAEPWKLAVQRETANPQIYALEPGTANVFEVELSYPRGWTQQDEAGAAERVAQREVQRLQALLVANGGDPGEKVEVSPLPKRTMELSSAVRFVVLHPSASLERDNYDGADCGPCLRDAMAKHALLLRNSGFAPLDLQTVTHEQLVAGVELHGHFSVGSPADTALLALDAPPEGRATLRLVESCKAKVLRVEKKLNVGNGSGVIAVPRYEEHAWYELRDTPCAGDGVTSRRDVGPQFNAGQGVAPSQRRVWELQQQLDRLGVAH